MMRIERWTAASPDAVLRAIGDTERHREPADPIHPGPRRQVLATRNGARFTLRLMPRIPLAPEHAPTLHGTVQAGLQSGSIVSAVCGYNTFVASAAGDGYGGLLSSSAAVVVTGGCALAFQHLGMGLVVAAAGLLALIAVRAESRVRARDPDPQMRFLARRLELAIVAAERESPRAGTASASARRSG